MAGLRGMLLGMSSHDFVQGFAGEVREFCDAIIEKREANPNMEESVRVMRVIEAIAAKPDGTTEF